MNVRVLWNHELGPGEREMIDSLSAGRAIGAYIATESPYYFVVPVAAMELMDGDGREQFEPLFRRDAEEEFARLRAET